MTREYPFLTVLRSLFVNVEQTHAETEMALAMGCEDARGSGARRASCLANAAVVILTGFLVSACAVRVPLVGGFSDDDASERPAVKHVKKADNRSDPSLADQLSALWERATASSSDEALETVAPAESFTPDQALALVNSYRKDAGLEPLRLDPKLEQAALAHARDLAANDRISHFGSDGSDPWQRVSRTGFDPEVAAENVGAGQLTFGELMREWKRSPDHNRNLLLPGATVMGVAVVKKPDTQFKTFWSLVIGASS